MMGRQVRLTDESAARLDSAADSLRHHITWSNTREGHTFWFTAYHALRRMVQFRTSDGMPWQGDADEQTTQVIVDDAWAAVYPRRWVMVRDSEAEKWCGPEQLGCVCPDATFPVITLGATCWRLCRPCTPEEIAQMRAATQKALDEQPESEVPDFGKGYREATSEEQYRTDRDIWTDSAGWIQANPKRCRPGAYYRVPVDRIPTDKDARERPVVMVKEDGTDWHMRTLLAVLGDGFLVTSGSSFARWSHCRFPYPGELPKQSAGVFAGR